MGDHSFSFVVVVAWYPYTSHEIFRCLTYDLKNSNYANFYVTSCCFLFLSFFLKNNKQNKTTYKVDKIYTIDEKITCNAGCKMKTREKPHIFVLKIFLNGLQIKCYFAADFLFMRFCLHEYKYFHGNFLILLKFQLFYISNHSHCFLCFSTTCWIGY